MDKDLIKKYGKEAFITGQHILDNPHELISISPKLDLILGGGIPGGSIVTLAGIEKLGKSLTALWIAARCQNRGRKIFYLNVEGRLKGRDLAGIQGLIPQDVEIIGSYKGKILNAEDYLQIAENIIKGVPGSVVILDSVSQLCGEKELSCDMGETQRAPGAVLLSQFCKKIANAVPVNDNIVIMIQHMIANTSGYGAKLLASGGRKIAYAADIGMIGRSYKFLRPGNKDDDETSPPYGQEVMWQTTSTCFIPPGQKTTSIIRYGVGIDICSEYIALGCDFGIINVAGSWLELVYSGKKIQGKENLYQYLQTQDGKNDYKILQEEVGKITNPNK